MHVDDIIKACDIYAASVPGGVDDLNNNITAANQWLFNRSRGLIKGDCCVGVLDKFIKPIDGQAITIETIKQMVRDYASEMTDKVTKLEQDKEAVTTNFNACNAEVRRLQEALQNADVIEASFEQCKRELDSRLTSYEVDEKVKQEVNKVWNQAIASSRITFRQNAKLQSEVAGCKAKIVNKDNEINELKDRLNKRVDVEPGGVNVDCMIKVFRTFLEAIYIKMGFYNLD